MLMYDRSQVNIFEYNRPDAEMTSEANSARRLSGRARIANFVKCLVNYDCHGLTLQDQAMSYVAEL